MQDFWYFLDGGPGRSSLFTPQSVVLSLLVAFVMGQLLAWVYYATHSGLSYSRSYVQSLILITVVVSMVMTVIANSIITAVGLMGALALVVTLSSAGLPGLNGFVGEFLILSGTYVTLPWIAIAGSTGLILAVGYALIMVQRALHGPARFVGRDTAAPRLVQRVHHLAGGGAPRSSRRRRSRRK